MSNPEDVSENVQNEMRNTAIPPKVSAMDFLKLHPFVRTTAHDKVLGTIVGAALGDAIGLYTEFLPRTECLRAYPGKFFLAGPKRTDFRADSHRDKFSPGEWTDDTDQSLLLILSYLHNLPAPVSPVVDAQDIALRINNWITQGLRCLDRPPLGIGQTIGRVVLDPDYLKDPEGVALKIWLKSKRNAAPNGSLMRTHPLGAMCIGRTLEETFRVATDVGRVTHIDPRCVVSCCLATALGRGILRGEVLCETDIDVLAEKAYAWVDSRDELKNPENRKTDGDWTEVTATREGGEESKLEKEEYWKHCSFQDFRDLQLDDSQKMGYVYKCLGSAILALRLAMRREASPNSHGTQLFEKIITELVMEGGDADTNACVAGALLGAWVGHARLPSLWQDGLSNGTWLYGKAQKMSLELGISVQNSGQSQNTTHDDPDTALDGGKGMLTKQQLDRRERDFVMMILEKQKARREAQAKEEQAKKGIGKWFSK
ncbi:ADP-ribosylglycohydrolase-domain-containing protein [Halenospora varia]|nr:ADP-ribosylglycohydrolase-domain-containing protein [Halenospora varia]